MTMTQDVRVLKLGKVQEWEQECVPASGRAGASTAKHKPGWSGRVWAWDELQGRGTYAAVGDYSGRRWFERDRERADLERRRASHDVGEP